MSIQLKVSNSLKSLSSNLAEELNRTSSVFEPVYIVTQTEGMNNWLRLQLAEQLGIAANIQFLKPNDLIHKVYKALNGKYQQSISSHQLTWLLFKALKDKIFIKSYPKITAYYKTGQFIDDQKRLALAEKLADLFDQYQIYRTDVIEKWNREWEEACNQVWDEKCNEVWNEDNRPDDWQTMLWCSVKAMAGDQFPDKTLISKFITKAIKDPQKASSLQQKLPTVYFFGLSLITQYHIRLISQIAQYIDIHFMIQNPAPEDYWFDEKSEKYLDYLKRKGRVANDDSSLANPILVGWGKLVQETFLMLFEDEASLNNYQEVTLNPPSTNTLLHKIQHSVYHNQKEGIYISSDEILDGSITINSCYNPMREVEVLYNYLVQIADQKQESLSARDIVVMVSDIKVYATYIRAIFDNAPYTFKYTIADESYAVADSISNTLIALLSINEKQFTSENVVSLLDFSSIRKQFNITDTSEIRKWTDAANIRFGFEGSELDDSIYVSWTYGLKRLMYGLCMAGGQEYGEGTNSIYPLDIIEGNESNQVVHFVHYVQSLISDIESRNKPRTLLEWSDYVTKVIYRFIGEPEDNNDEDYRILINQLGRYNTEADAIDELISYDVFIFHFLPSLSNVKRSHSYAGRGITFCSLIPMRSIPFKVVALLGMNYDKFPRKDNKVSFDLMSKEKRKGDRDLKENDKHLMLETLLSAEEKLYISYIGQSVKDNSQLPPSALVDELLDFVASKTKNPDEVRENFIQKHPLHGFSKKYNSNHDNLYSYLLSRRGESLDLSGQSEENILDFNEITIDRLSAFFKNPIKAYYNRILGVFYEDEDLSLRETELFELNHLEQWSLKNSLLDMDATNIQEYQNHLVKIGKLPLKNRGIVEIDNTMEKIKFVQNAYRELTVGKEKTSIDVSLKIDDSLITGRIDDIYEKQLIYYSFSKNDLKYQFDAYLAYLLLAAAGRDIRVVYISNNKEEITYGGRISQSDATARLETLISLYKNGHHTILPFDFSLKVELNEIGNLDLEKYNKKIKDYFENSMYPATDAYHIREYNQGLFTTDTAFEQYIEVAKEVLEPLKTFYVQDK